MSAQPRQNVLIICADEMRADHMGCAGNAIVQTPNIDRIAATGTRFTRSYVANPICMPARASMFTGLLPRDHGVRINGQNLRSDLPTLPGTLADAGYRTHSAGKLHLTAWVPRAPESQAKQFPESLEFWNNGVLDEFPTPYYGFQSVDFVGGHVSYAYGEYVQWLETQGGNRADLGPDRALDGPGNSEAPYKMRLPEELHYNRYIADSTIRIIEEASGDDQPFFAWCSFPDPHLPIAPPAPYWDMYKPDDIPIPPRSESERTSLPGIYGDVFDGTLLANGYDNSTTSDEYIRQIIAGTYGMITHMDTEIGRVLDALARSKATDNTLVVFLADHGDMMGDHGLVWKSFYTFQGCIRIPTIVSMPGITGGNTSESLISQIDLMPSVLEACDVPVPGEDWTETDTPFQRGVYDDLHPYPGRSWLGLLNDPSSCVREAVVLENDDPVTGLRPRTLVTDRYRLTAYPGSDEGELFDLDNDPDELENLWNTNMPLRQELITTLFNELNTSTPWNPIPPWNS